MNDKTSPIYMPATELYLGREIVFAFDKVIVACMEVNERIAPYTYKIEKSDLQLAACQIIPQGISIALSIRELVRQGYLFGALVLTRSLVERATIILYLRHNPEKVGIWKRGWKYNERPNPRLNLSFALVTSLHIVHVLVLWSRFRRHLSQYSSHLV